MRNTHFLLEPAHGLLFADAVSEADAARFPLLVGDAEAGSAQNLNAQKRTETERVRKHFKVNTNTPETSVLDISIIFKGLKSNNVKFTA